LSEKGVSICQNRKQFQIRFGESVWSILSRTITQHKVLHLVSVTQVTAGFPVRIW